jgi:hypothetical protein
MGVLGLGVLDWMLYTLVIDADCMTKLRSTPTPQSSDPDSQSLTRVRLCSERPVASVVSIERHIVWKQRTTEYARWFQRQREREA